jgi:VWFA-related protein
MTRFPALLLLATLFASLFATNTLAQYTETITVSRVVLDLRVTKLSGEPVTDLEPEEFTILIGGKPSRVASVTWIDDAVFDDGSDAAVVPEDMDPEEAAALAELQEQAAATAPQGRLFVAFVQTDFSRASARVRGQLKFRSYAKELVESFAPNDRVAVLSFDSHLKFRRDFTADKEDVAEAMGDSIYIDNPPAPPAVDEPSLARFLDHGEMKNASTAEAALLLVAKALGNIEGPKTLLLCGYGLGDRFAGKVIMRDEWGEARDRFLDARTTIISLNTSEAPGQLSAGLAGAAKSTGGFYASTASFPQQAINRTKNTLRGRYDLELIADASLGAGTHKVEARVKRKGTVVLAPTSVVISD